MGKIEKHDCKKFYYKSRYFGKALRCSCCGKVVDEMPLDWEDIKMDLLILFGLVKQQTPNL